MFPRRLNENNHSWLRRARTTVALPAVSAGPRCTGMAKSAAAFCAVNVIEPEGVSFNRNLPTNDPEHLAQSELLLVTLKAAGVQRGQRAAAEADPTVRHFAAAHGMGTGSCRRTASRSCRAPPPTPRATKAAPLSTSPPASPTSARPRRPPSTSATGGSAASSAARRCTAQQHRLGQLAQAGGQLRDQPVDGAVRLP